MTVICGACKFETQRLSVGEWRSLSGDEGRDQELAQIVCSLLTPSVTQSLPERWQGEYTIERASDWIRNREREGATLLVLERSSRSPVGLVILFESIDEQLDRTVRLGYLLSEPAWGKGLATELVCGFVDWCRTVNIATILGGVERHNVSSRRVLEKNGFVCKPAADNKADLFCELHL